MVKNSRQSKIESFMNHEEEQETSTPQRRGRKRKDETTNLETSETETETKRRKRISDEPIASSTGKRRGRRKKEEINQEEEELTTAFKQAEKQEEVEDNMEYEDNLEDSDATDVADSLDESKPKRRRGRKRSENRQILVAADRDSGKVHGIFLDAGHAAFVLGKKVGDIKSDLNRGTNKTKLAWLKVPAGDTLDQKQIIKDAKDAFKEWKVTGGVPEKKKPGRKPARVAPKEVESMIDKTDLNQLDAKTLRQIKNLLSKHKSTSKAKA